MSGLLGKQLQNRARYCQEIRFQTVFKILQPVPLDQSTYSSECLETPIRTSMVHANLGPWVLGPQVPRSPGPRSLDPGSLGPLNIVSLVHRLFIPLKLLQTSLGHSRVYQELLKNTRNIQYIVGQNASLPGAYQCTYPVLPLCTGMLFINWSYSKSCLVNDQQGSPRVHQTAILVESITTVDIASGITRVPLQKTMSMSHCEAGTCVKL